ncbi:MAG TPA: aldehyde ferredoxin oxidoreductase N-terminal domain-containing protein, partial [Verrucomicrobiae bacterium]|nr:aldehyde ferredoxin oxidoreductase N-terminal domain-containing protein [Verrucomicrobiae bacterium]
MHAWTGNILKVDLTTGSAQCEQIPRDLLLSYLGGRGLGVRLMREHFHLDPLHPEIPLIFAVGPLCGTPAPTAARMAVVSRSPLTGTIYDCSAGGRFAWRLKAAGYDALFVTGRSSAPCVLSVTSQRATLAPAGALWGKTTFE